MATGLRLWDRLILFLAWTVTCGLVYLLGFYVGKGVEEQRLGTEERLVRLPVTAGPPAAGQRPKSDLTFYDTLAKSAERPASPTPEPAPPRRATGTLPPRATATTTLPAPAPTTPPRAAAPPPTAPPPAPAPTTPPPRAAAPRPVERAVTPPPPAPSERAERAEPPPTTSARGNWTVQASPTRSREEAQALLRRLRAKGYDASIVEVPRDGGTWYRIRVGRYASAGQATEAMQRLREQEGVAHVFVASE
jgi:cell division septation protein DedD